MKRTNIVPSSQKEQASKHNLPAQPTPLIGREEEVQAASTLLRRPDMRLLTLAGTAGIGKTRLALQVATELLQDFADGVSFVPLASIIDPDLVVLAIAQTLRIGETGTRPLLDLLQASLRNKQVLLLLDNFEQVVTAAPLVAELLEACPAASSGHRSPLAICIGRPLPRAGAGPQVGLRTLSGKRSCHC